MLRTDSTVSGSGANAQTSGLADRQRAICIVTPRGTDLTETIATHAAAGTHTHVLACSAPGTELALWRRPGVTVWHLEDFVVPTEMTLSGPHLFAALHDSDRVAYIVQLLHAEHRFRSIEFPLRGGLGFRSVQAKQTGQAFTDVALLVHGDRPTATSRHQQGQWLYRTEEMTLDYMERYVLAHADLDDAGFEPLLGRRQSSPLVTICVPYFNLGEFLDETLCFLAAQSYANLEVMVINDGSTDQTSIDVFQRLRREYPRFRFLEQANAGIGATRNRGLQLAQGEYFLPVDADNIAHPDMVSRLVAGMERNRDIAALTCYFLAFREFSDLIDGRFAYAYKPTGGPRVLGCLQNVYGDGNALFRTEALRAVGGFETDRGTSFEDWEAFVKLANAGHRIDVLPDFLFYYRHRDAGFSRATDACRNQQRVLRQFIKNETWTDEERSLIWNWLVGSQLRLAELENENQALQARLSSGSQRVADGFARGIRRLMRVTKSLVGM